MPLDFMSMDVGFSPFTGKESLEERVDILQNQVFMLLEQLRYTLFNLDPSRNFNEAASNAYASAITEPVTGRIADAEGNITELGVTANGLATRVSDAEGNITVAQQTANGAMVTAQNAAGQAQAVALTVDGFTVTGPGGQTLINGNYIRSGTIEGANLVSDGGSSTRIEISDGQIYFGAGGTSAGLKADMTGIQLWSGFPMNMPISITCPYGDIELEAGNLLLNGNVVRMASDGNMVIDAGGGRTIFIGTTNGSETITIGSVSANINLVGNVRVNGVPI